ncbi:uncharacterized protein IUM83_12837 [Phytophthora cinnamomi]|uniref:uncharacterized protein n=1 Tax=Phytophthora cinnamomi TaxID=4785 RepID=UPI003559587D|nr:hypothetical protein IUM83_12837 [Phytophthora cinnamomi]
MNWMTSGRHRALYSQRGRRRQMHFPSQVQRQRVRPSSPVRSSHPARARDSTTPWYILPVGDDDESQDIRVLELERKGAMSAIGDVASVIPEETAAGSAQDTSEASGGDRPRPTRKRSREDAAQDVRSETRCIFTPVKKARKYDQLPSAVERSRRAGGERPPSSVASGVDMLFFNDGEEMPQKNQAQHEKQTSIALAPTQSGSDRFSQRRSENRVQDSRRECPEDQDMHRRHPEALDNLSDGEKFSFYEPQLPRGGVSERDFQLARVNSNSCADPDSGMTFADRENELFTSATDSIQEKMHDTAPLSPFTSSPLSFRMSRAEVLQSQLHSQATRADQLEVRTTFTASSRASPSSSPSTSTSSQGSIVLGRPPPGWQKRMFQSLTEDRTAKPKLQFGNLVSAPEDADPVSPMTTGKHPDNSRPLVIPSSRSSTGGDGSRSICDALIDVDTNERIMAAATSQQLPGHSLMRFQRPPIEETRGVNSVETITCRKAMQRSWVMSSRTKRILDAVSVSKTSATEKLTHDSTTKYQEMESVAIYMCTLVQCYKINENIRADTTTSPVVDDQSPPKPTSPSKVTVVSTQAACRREIIFSPKHAN